MSTVNLYSHEIDSSITIELLKSIKVGDTFPKIQGVATASYANSRYPELPLHEAIKKYVEDIEASRIARANAPIVPHVKVSAFEYVDYVDGVIVDDWDMCRAGRLISTVGEKKSDCRICINKKFTVSSKEEAIELVRAIIEALNTDSNASYYIYHYGLTHLHFSGNMCFAASNIPPISWYGWAKHMVSGHL